MITKRELTLKWIAYVLCALLLMFLRTLLLGNLKLWGVLPFLPPVILACIASLEDSSPTTVFGLIYGIYCDLILSAPFPALYTISFTLASLIAFFLSTIVLQKGFFRAISATFLTFTIVDGLNIVVLLARSGGAIVPMLFLCIREMLVSCLLLICYPLFSLIHRFFTL